MASDQSVPAQVVGNAFVQQFYLILHQSPQLVYRFYQESNKPGRADANGAMDSVTTMQAINEKIPAMNYSELKAEIKTVDAQESYYGGVTVLVTGYLTGKDLVKKKFTQSFFLAPQEKGFFVLNDIFRYVDEDDNQLETVNLANGTAAPLSAEEVPDSPPPHEEAVQEQTSPPVVEKEEENGKEVYNPPEKEEDPVVAEEDHVAVEEEAPVEEVINDIPSVPQAVVAETSPAITLDEEAPKKSYASIVKVMKENPAPLLAAPVPVRPAPPPTKRVSPPARSAPAPSIVPGPPQMPELPAHGSNVTENSNAQEPEADDCSIYVKNLPLSATPEQLEEEFKKFGAIKPGGIQVKINKMQGFCFGFVEFEVASAVQSAVEASPVMIGGRKAFVEEKRTTTLRGSNDRGRFGPGRGGSGFRSDGSRGGRGSYGIARGGGGESYGGRGGSYGGRRGGRGGYQRVDHVGPTGRGRGGRSGNSSPKSVTPRVPAPA